MLKFENAPDNVLALHMSGTITKRDIQAIERAVGEKLTRHRKIGFYVDMTGLSEVTGEAVLEDLKFEMRLLGKLNRFPRVAIVSDKRWIAAVVKVVGPLIPMVKVKAFTPDAYDQAMAFAADLPMSR